MCRLLGTVSTAPVTVDELLGDEREAFLALATQHGDGWGHAWTGPDGLQVRKEATSALVSRELTALAAGERAESSLTHLRWATLGLSVRPANTHPFTAPGYAFAHNGSISPPEALEVLIAPHLRHQRQGDTDSERYFLAVLSRIAEGASPTEALARTVADVLAGGAVVHSLNCLLLTPEALLAVCCYDPDSSDGPEYYRLLYRRTRDTVVVASTGWSRKTDWSSLPNGQLLVVERGSLRTTLFPVSTPSQVRMAE